MSQSHNLTRQSDIREVRIRIPKMLKMRLELAAYDNDRSLNHEIWTRLSASVREDDTPRYRFTP